jgi:hypothetical protein
LHIDGWRQLQTDFVSREAIACGSCGGESILREEWVQ